MNNSVKVVICSSNFRQNMTIKGETYSYPDSVVWDPVDSRYTIRMHGQKKGQSEDILDQFIAGAIDFGLFVHSGARRMLAGNGMVIEPGFIGKLEQAICIAKRGPGHDGPSVYSLTIQEIEKDMQVATPTTGQCWRKWGKLCHGLGVSFDKVEIVEGSVNHGIFAVRVDGSTTELQRIADRLT
jgi:hypothetical protein